MTTPWLRRCCAVLTNATLTGWELWTSTDLENRFFFAGLLLLAVGLFCVSPTVAFIVLGVILILAVKPLRGWFDGRP